MNTSAQRHSLGVVVESGAHGPFAAPSQIIQLFELSEPDFAAIRDAVQVLARFRSQLRFLDLVRWNLEDYFFLQSRLLTEGLHPEQNPLRTPDLDLNRRLMNLLSSVRSYLDHTETDLKRQFGAASDRVSRFTTLTSHLYDAHFSYRFLYQLRNFVQHCGLPLDHVAHNQSPTSLTLEVTVSRRRLLEGFDWRKLKAEVESLPETIDLNPLLLEHVGHLETLHQRLCAEELPAVRGAAEHVIRTASKLQGRPGLPTVFTIVEELTPEPPPSPMQRMTFKSFSLDLPLARALLSQVPESRAEA